MEVQLSAGIVRLRTADLNIPEADSCGEAVEAALIPLSAEEKRVVTKPTHCQAERRTSGRLRPLVRSRSTPTPCTDPSSLFAGDYSLLIANL